MTARTRHGVVVLCLAVALLAGVAAAAGVFLRGDHSTATTTSIRGETYDYVLTGVYAYNSERFVAEGAGWDYFTLFLAVPAMLLALPWLGKGSLRARLFAVGLLGYFFYQYLMYSLAWAFGPLFPLFIVVYALSLAGIVWIVSSIRIPEVAETFAEGFPRRGVAALSLGMALVLVLMWSQRILAGLQGDWGTAMLAGGTTMVVQALDLGVVVPLCVLTGVAVLQRRPLGYLLAPVLVVKAVAMASAIFAMLLSAWAVEGSPEIGSMVVFGSAALASAWLGLKMYRVPSGRGPAADTRSASLPSSS